MSWTPFFLKRIGPKGADTAKHLFCVGAKGNPELVRTGETDAEVLINGAGGKGVRDAVQKLVDALNGCWEAYLRGEYHEYNPEQDMIQANQEARMRVYEQGLALLNKYWDSPATVQRVLHAMNTYHPMHEDTWIGFPQE